MNETAIGLWTVCCWERSKNVLFNNLAHDPPALSTKLLPSERYTYRCSCQAHQLHNWRCCFYRKRNLKMLNVVSKSLPFRPCVRYDVLICVTRNPSQKKGHVLFHILAELYTANRQTAYWQWNEIIDHRLGGGFGQNYWQHGHFPYIGRKLLKRRLAVFPAKLEVKIFFV